MCVAMLGTGTQSFQRRPNSYRAAFAYLLRQPNRLAKNPLARRRQDIRIPLVCRQHLDQPVSKAQEICFGGSNPSARQDHVARSREPYQRGEAVRAASPWDYAESGFGESDRGGG